MAQGYNTCFRNLPPLSSDSRTLNVPLDSEESLAHHLETLIEHNDLSNTVVSPENTSSDLNLSSNFFSNSNTSSDFVQQKYYDDVVWQDEGQPVHHGGQFNHTSNSLFAPARAASSSNCLSTSGADLNSHDLKQECDLLNPSIPEDYSDVSSCSESNVDRTGPSCEMLKHGSNDTPLVADDKKGNECAWKCPETNTGSPESMSASESEVEEDQDEPPEKEKETFMMQEDKYSETSGAPESLSVSEDEGEEDHLDGEAHEEKDEETCMKQEGQHTGAPSGVEKSQAASVSEGKEELDDVAQNAGEEGYMEEEDRYSNVSSLEGQNEGTIIRESFKEKEAHSLSQGTMDSQGINTSNAQDAANKLNDNTCAFEYHDSVKDNDSLKVAGQDNGKGSSVIYGLGLGGSNQTFESCLEFPENQSLKTRFQEIVGSGAQSTNSTYEESESDSIHASGGKEDHSSFDFLERCLGLNSSGIEPKSFIENEWLRPMDESNVSSCLEEDQTSQQNLMHHIEPPDLVKAGLENTREPFHKGFTADDEQEPPVLSECYGEPLSRKYCMRDIEGNQEKEETGSIDSTELNQEGGDSTIDNIEDKRDFEDLAAELKSSLHVRKRMHPIVLLRNSEQKNDIDGAYQCAACQQTTQSIDHLIEHHHCNHTENKFNFCQTCGTYLTRDSLAKKHHCGIIDENAQLSSNMKPQKTKSAGHTFHKCRYCTQTFYRLCDYNKHVQSHSVRTEHKCHRCGSYFSQSGSLNRHLCEKKCQRRSSQVPVKQIQTNPRISIYKKGTVHPYVLPPDSPYANLPDCFVKLVDICKEHVCRRCGKSFTSSAKLYKHGYNVHHTKTRSYNVRPKCQNTYRSYKCQKCQMTFNYSSNFSRHKKRCKGAETKEKFKCPLCPRLFKYSYNRSRHLREQCIKDFAQGSSGKVDMKFRCPFCTTTFTNASNRHRHIRLVCLKEYMHNETSRTKAERQENVDQKEKTQKPTLKTALNQNELGLKCNYCPAVFAHSSGKYRHMRKHKLFENTGEKITFSYSSVVPISNKSKASIEEPNDGPLSSEASSQPFSCRFCGKCFNASYSLKKHICSMHKGDKPYRCLECGKRFGKEIHLVAHKKVHQRRIQCTVCKKILPTIGDLIQHRQSHIKKGMLQCPDCPSQFQYPVYLLRHMASHHKLQQEQPLKEKKQRHPSKLEPLGSLPPLKEQEEEDNLGCPLCPEVFHSATELSSHCLNHDSESSSSQCPFCKRLFSSRTSLVRHIRIHTGEKPFSCQSCGAPFRRKEYLQLHQEKCPGPQSKQEQPTIKESEDVSSKSLVTRIRKVHKCSYCPREFEKLPRLMLHHNGHMQNTVIPCPKCGKCYRQRRKLHERLCNGSNIKSEEPVSTVLHPCRNCGRKFSRDYNLNVHESTCNTVKPLQKNTSNSGNSNMHPCRNCGKYFTRSDNRNVHEKTCNSAKPLQKNTLEIRTSSRDKLQHKCPHCPSKFKYRSLLLRHIGSHTGERSYPCMHCGHSYAIQSRCLQHEAFCDGVNRQKPPSVSLVEYKCNICTKTFMKSRNLRRHILTHTEVKPYRCKACDSCFSRHDHLKLHQSRCKGKRQRLEVRIAKISLTDVGRGWQNNLNNTDSGTQQGFDCSICSKSFPTPSIMARHIAMSHAIRTISSFTHGKSLKRHTSVGACQRIYAKTKHSKKLNVTSPPSRETNRLLQRIQLQYKDKRKFKCTFCPRLFKSGEQLRVHTRLHTGEKPFGCSNCGERFIRRDYLQRHLNRCKGEPLDRVLCDRCGDVFSQEELENHLLTCVVKCKSPARSLTDSTARSPPKGFSCANCSAHFLLFSQLQQHFLNTHSEAPTNQASPLQEQLSSMVNIKEEPMDEGYGDTQQNSDNNLMLNQDSDPNNDMNKPIECPQCNMHFGNKGGFARHMRTHLGQYPFNCKKCKKGFWNKNLCRTHVRKCRLVKVTKEEIDTLITSEMDPTLKETVLVFNQGSKTTGTGVLQTNFFCKDDLKDLTLQSSFGNQGKGSSSNDRTNCGQQVQGNKYQCSECDRSFTDGLLLISHLEDHGHEELERKKKSCQHCGKTFANPSDLGRHMRVHWNEKTHSCPECPQTFLCPSDLDIHRTCHDSNRPFVCKECQQRFWTSQSLENHKSQAHPKELIYTCHVCNKNYSIRSSLVKHIRMKHQTQKNMDVIHVKEKETAVQEEFDMEVDVDGGSNASNDEDENEDNEDNDSDSADYFPCHVCGKTFTTSESLEDHQRCHLGEKPHECAECGKCFFQAGQLQQHLRSHKSEYQCQICGRGFVSLFALRKHKHTHGKSRQHRCSKCPLSFTGPSQLAEHMGTHRDDNFPCDICDRTFSCKMSRAEHRKIHTETEDVPLPLLLPEKTASPSPTASSSTMKHLQYRCGVCNERFKEPEQLSEHGCMAARERPYSCQECNKHFLHASHLNKHELSHYQIPQSYVYRCNQCHMSFNYRHNFVSHLKKHGDDEAAAEALKGGSVTNAWETVSEKRTIYKCPICPHRFTHAIELASHLSIHSENTFDCSVCKLTFPTKNKLAEHEQSHLTAATQYECTECGQSFLGSDFRQHHCARRQRAVTDHERPHLSNRKSMEEEVDVGEDFFNCTVCLKRFSSRGSLQQHLNKEHPNERPFKCQSCGKTFALKRYLRDHERRQHKFGTELAHPTYKATDSERQYKCSVCPKTLTSAHDLSLHMKVHTEQESGGDHRCDMCYKSFSRLSLLRQHQESHVGQVVYECTECDKAFAFPHLLEEHQKTHAAGT